MQTITSQRRYYPIKQGLGDMELKIYHADIQERNQHSPFLTERAKCLVPCKNSAIF